jgi:glutamate carboxypeptidase
VLLARRPRPGSGAEPSLDGAAKVARKGTGLFRLAFTGRAAHAGLEPEKGASALSEMARTVPVLESLANVAKGTTVTPTLARAGSASNVVPEAAELTVDVRVWTEAEALRVDAAVRAVRPADRRVAIAVEGGFTARRSSRPRMPRPSRSARGSPGARLRAEAARGRRFDGNLTAAAGIPPSTASVPGVGARP